MDLSGGISTTSKSSSDSNSLLSERRREQFQFHGSGGGYFVLLRLYGPLKPWFDKTWKPGDFELVE